jgi:hypothetical protein
VSLTLLRPQKNTWNFIKEKIEEVSALSGEEQIKARNALLGHLFSAENDTYGFWIGTSQVNNRHEWIQSDGMCGFHAFLWLFYAFYGTLIARDSVLVGFDQKTNMSWGQYSPGKDYYEQNVQFAMWLRNLLFKLSAMKEIMDVCGRELSKPNARIRIDDLEVLLRGRSDPDLSGVSTIFRGVHLSSDSCNMFGAELERFSKKLKNFEKRTNSFINKEDYIVPIHKDNWLNEMEISMLLLIEKVDAMLFQEIGNAYLIHRDNEF